jgi:Ca2+-binding EF-hand superfamily protein
MAEDTRQVQAIASTKGATSAAATQSASDSSASSGTSSNSTNSTGKAQNSQRAPADEVALSLEAKDAIKDDDAIPPYDYKEQYRDLDHDGDGKVTRQDLNLDKDAFARKDANGDGRISRREFRADFNRENSFENLDADQDGGLSPEEMSKLQRFDSRNYDLNDDGMVDSSEFVASRKAEMNGARRARINTMLEGLEGEDLAKMAEKFDADGDGKVTTDEVLTGRREARENRRSGLSRETFKALAGDNNGISVSDNKQYRKYDTNGDGCVSKAEFLDGQGADYQKLRDDRYLNGGNAPDARRRLGLDSAGQPVPGTASAPVDVGGINNITWDKAAAIIRSQGGKLFENGEPTVLAIRTDNSGTQTYDDYFVVLKPNGKMQTFTASTRPGFTTDSGGWSPDMVLTGNYRVTPRPADSKWNNAFYIGTDKGYALPAAKDTNGDGRYSKSEIAHPVLDDEIRLHPGNATTTSSAGCFNVQDYDAFVKFIGGHDVSFNMTLING